jgi:hypothetical protein
MPNIALPLASLSATLGSVSLALLAFLIARHPAFPLVFTTLLGIGGVICLLAAASCIDFAIDSLNDDEIKEIGNRVYRITTTSATATAAGAGGPAAPAAAPVPARTLPTAYENPRYGNQIALRFDLFGRGYVCITLALATLTAILVITFFGPLAETKPAWGIVSNVFAAFWAAMVIWKMMTLESTLFPLVAIFGLGVTIAAFVFHWLVLT